MFAATDIVENLPFPILGIDSDNGGECINAELLRYCGKHGLNVRIVASTQSPRGWLA